MKRCVRPLICPVCRAPLAKVGNTLKCPRSHSFDIAREGYVNLLLAHGKRPKFMGDSRQMLRARRRFLAQGHYSPLIDSINEIVWDYLKTEPEAEPRAMVDVGCGEGTVTGRLQQHLSKHQAEPAWCYFGLDIAKAAARMAAKTYKQVRFVVADVKGRLPFASQSMRLVVNVFAPRNGEAFGRILAPQGLLLIVIPGPDHLLELRTHLSLLDIEEDKRQKITAQLAPLFTLQASYPLTYKMDLDNEALGDLIQMMPSSRHLSAQTQQSIQTINHIRATAAFELLLFRKGR